jgi:hypothetical protein
VDEHTREALTITVERRIDANATVAVLDRLVAEHQTAPRFLRCDNCPELTANAPAQLLPLHRRGDHSTPTDYANAWTAGHPALS